MKARYIYNKIIKDKASPWGRIIVLTGARQTGKTTIAKSGFLDYSYLSIEDPVMCRQYAMLSAQQWNALYPKAILDEVQKEPSLIESIKSVYDQWETPKYVLTGSSQLLMMKKSQGKPCLKIYNVGNLSFDNTRTWERNENKRLVKSPKVQCLDYGVLQAVTGKCGMLSGMEFESMVVAELFKQAKQTGLPVRFYYLRTASGVETDCLIETEKGYYAFEIKQTEHVKASDARHLRVVSGLLDKPLLHGFLLSNDPVALRLSDNIMALNVAWFLG